MRRLVITGIFALALVGFGTDRFLHEFEADPTGSVVTATDPNSGPGVPYTPRPDPPCASDITSAKGAVAGAQGVLTLDHNEARISASQLKTLSHDLTQEAKSAEQGSDWGGVCRDISQVESQATAE